MNGPVLAVDSAGLLAPTLIIATCAIVSTVAIVVRRRRTARARADGADAAGGGVVGSGGRGADRGERPTDLLAWQQTQGHHVDAWLDAHERTLPQLQPGADPAIDAELDEAMGSAADVCPNPDVARMLLGMRGAAHATRAAITGGDRDGATEAHSTYARHRSDAVAAMNEVARDGGPPSG